MTTLFKVLDARHYQQVYFCGDIHGRLDLLQHELLKREFVPTTDLLVLVGDLIDRGDLSSETVNFVLEGIDAGNIVMVAGNHDLFPAGDYTRWMDNGGLWFHRIKENDPRQADCIMQNLLKVAQQPLALQLEFDDISIGVVHGDVPENDWNVLQELNEHSDKLRINRYRQTLLSGRSLLKASKLKSLNTLLVGNIDFVVSGHTIVERPLFIANRAYIDTGAFCSEKLTIVSLDEILSGFAKG